MHIEICTGERNTAEGSKDKQGGGFIFDRGPKTGTFMEVVALCLKSKGCITAALKNLTAKEIMSASAISAFADISASDIADIFTNRNINRLPIITSEGRPIGIVTRSDLVTSICSIQ